MTRASAWGRLLTTARVVSAACLLALAAGGCAAVRPKVPPSQGHLDSGRVAAKATEEKIPAPVTSNNFVPAPKPQVKVPTYSVVVNEVPVKELLFALSRDTGQNIDVHPDVSGFVTLNAIDQTLPSILDRISRQVNIRYTTGENSIYVMADSPFLRSYRVNHVNVQRDTASSIGVSGDIGGGSSSSSGGSQTSGSNSATIVTATSKNNFWEILRDNMRSILTSARTAELPKAERELERSAIVDQIRLDERRAALLADASRNNNQQLATGVALATLGGPGLTANAANISRAITSAEIGNDVIVNPLAGTVTVMAPERLHKLVQEYLDNVNNASQRQVLIEATIVEVRLSNNYQGGVDWSRIASGTGFTFNQQLLGTSLGTAPRMIVGYTNLTSTVGNIAASLRLLEQFGNTRVLSSPKLMALNNQTALLKVVDNIVYFEVKSDTTPATLASAAITTFTTTAKTIPVGLIMSVLPQVTDTGTVNLTVRPTISSVTRFVPDPNPSLQVDGQGNQLANPVPNLIPQIQIREMESVLQAGSGQTIILGGLMQDDVQRNRDAVPGLGKLPSPIGDAFSFRDERVRKTELVIFLKPTVISNPSLDSDELKFFRRFLPTIDPSGKTP